MIQLRERLAQRRLLYRLAETHGEDAAAGEVDAGAQPTWEEERD